MKELFVSVTVFSILKKSPAKSTPSQSAYFVETFVYTYLKLPSVTVDISQLCHQAKIYDSKQKNQMKIVEYI